MLSCIFLVDTRKEIKPALTPNDYEEELRFGVRYYLAKNLTTCRFGFNLTNFDGVRTTNVKNIHWMLANEVSRK